MKGDGKREEGLGKREQGTGDREQGTGIAATARIIRRDAIHGVREYLRRGGDAPPARTGGIRDRGVSCQYLKHTLDFNIQ